MVAYPRGLYQPSNNTEKFRARALCSVGAESEHLGGAEGESLDAELVGQHHKAGVDDLARGGLGTAQILCR